MIKSLSIDDVGVSRASVFQEIQSGVGFETGDFVKEMLGGATVERLIYIDYMLYVPYGCCQGGERQQQPKISAITMVATVRAPSEGSKLL